LSALPLFQRPLHRSDHRMDPIMTTSGSREYQIFPYLNAAQVEPARRGHDPDRRPWRS
jgi:hypothetical protein